MKQMSLNEKKPFSVGFIQSGKILLESENESRICRQTMI